MPPQKGENHQNKGFLLQGAPTTLTESNITPRYNFHRSMLERLRPILPEAAVWREKVYAPGNHGNQRVLKLAKMTNFQLLLKVGTHHPTPFFCTVSYSCCTNIFPESQLIGLKFAEVCKELKTRDFRVECVNLPLGQF